MLAMIPCFSGCGSGSSSSGSSSPDPELVGAPFHPRFLAGGETTTVTGKYLGDNAGTVRLEKRTGESVPAQVLAWRDEFVTFEVPTGLSGLWDLVVTTGAKKLTERSWCTFERLPEGATGVGGEVQVVGVNQESHDTAVAIQFEGCLWVFDTRADDDKIVSDCFNLTTNSWNDTPDPPGESYTQQAPVVVDGVLWLFNTTRNGTVEYSKYDSAAAKWSSATQIPNVTTPDDSAVGVAYNSVSSPDRMELFYYNGGNIYRTYTDNHAQSWSTPASVISGAAWGPDALFWDTAVYWDSTRSATVSVPNGTLVGYQVSNGIAVAYLQDGKVVHTEKKTTGSTLMGFLPKLVDLGEDFIAVVSGDLNCQPAIRKMAKATGAWDDVWKPLSYNSNSPCWNPTGALGVAKVADQNSKGGYRYDTYFELFYGYNGGHLLDDDQWKMKNVEYLGYYLEPDAAVPTDFASEMHDLFYTWPVVGVMDAVPFVLNGHSIGEYDCIPDTECAVSEFGIDYSTAVEVGLGGSIGAYIETGEKSKVKLEISAEVNHDINKEWSQTVSETLGLVWSLEGNVMVLYVAPNTQTHTYEWYNHDNLATGKDFHVVELLGLSLTNMIFDPRESPCPGCLNVPDPYWVSFPPHAAETDLERLATFDTVPTEPQVCQGSATWNAGGTAPSFEFTTDASKTIENGGDIEFKIGKGGLVGGGVEGSFELHLSTTVSVMTNVRTTLVNFEPSHPGDVSRFQANGYWLQPSSSAYWVPTNRLGLGDLPWFTTYYVTGILQEQ